MSSTLQRKVQSALSSRLNHTEIENSLHGLHDFYQNYKNLDKKSNNDNSNNNNNNSDNSVSLSNNKLNENLSESEDFEFSSTLPSALTLQHFQNNLATRFITVNSNYLHSFQHISTEIHSLRSSLNSLANIAELLNQKITESKRETAELLENTKKFSVEKNNLAEKSSLIAEFLHKFQLSNEDLKCLEGENSIIDEKFFNALTRIGTIKNSCTQLLLNSTHQRIGLDLLDLLAKKLDFAYEKLYRFIQLEAQKLNKIEDIRTEFVYGLLLLKFQPIYYEHCVNEINQTRRLVLIQKFMRALTRGTGNNNSNNNNNNNNNTNKPIEINAHDPQRFISDMLAWIHQQIPSEKEFLITLHTLELEEQDNSPNNNNNNNNHFIVNNHTQNPNSGYNMNNNTNTNNNNHNDNQLNSKELLQSLKSQGLLYNPELESATLLSTIFEGLSRPLRVRIEQSLGLNPQPELAFKLVNIVQFYIQLIQPHFPIDSVFYNSLQLLNDLAQQNYFEIAKKQGEKLLRNPPVPTQDLSPSHNINELILQIINIMNTFQTSVVNKTTSNNNSIHNSTNLQQEFSPVLSCLLDPLLDSARVGCKSLSPSDTSVYLINLYHSLILSLNSFQFVRFRVETLVLEIDNQINNLIKLQAEQVLIKYGLANLATIIIQNTAKTNNNNNNVVALSSIKELSSIPLGNSMKLFVASLFDRGIYVISQSVCDRILHPKIRSLTRISIAKTLSNYYKFIYDTVNNPLNQYINPLTLLPTQPKQIDLLLEISNNNSSTIDSNNINHINQLIETVSVGSFLLEESQDNYSNITSLTSTNNLSSPYSSNSSSIKK